MTAVSIFLEKKTTNLIIEYRREYSLLLYVLQRLNKLNLEFQREIDYGILMLISNPRAMYISICCGVTA